MTRKQDSSLDACRSLYDDESPAPKLSDWRFGVTTCIAAIARPYHIVTASDTRLSFGGDYSTDGVLKEQPIHREWGILIAGNDMAQAPPVIDEAKRRLRGKSGDLRTVRTAFRSAYQSCRREVMTDRLLSSFDMTIDDFKKRGRSQLPPALYVDLAFQIKNFNLGCTFLVYGFDDDSFPHLFTIRNPGHIESYDRPGFWAIGAGASSALSMLALLKQNSERSMLDETIYNVLAAKFSSESASDVGPETWLWIKKFNCIGFSNSPGMEKEIREQWETIGKPFTLASARTVIANSGLHFIERPRPWKLQKKA